MISYRAPQPQLAADVANAVAQSYLLHTYNLRVRSAAGMTAFMKQQMDELHAKMEQSGQALARFERELSIVNPEEKTTILSARLLQLSTEYTNAQADRVRREAIWNSVRSGDLASVQVSGQAEQLMQLNQKVNESRQRFAEIRTTYGTSHPEYRKAASALSETSRQFEEMRANVGQRVKVDYDQAAGREQLLQRTLAQTKAEYDRLSTKSFEYQQLKREAEADKKLYEELVRKIKEAGINVGFQNSNIRIADTARPGRKPVLPNLTLNCILAALLSMGAAIATAVVMEVTDSTFRDPERASRALGTDVIGALPIVKEMPRANLLGAPAPASELPTLNAIGKRSWPRQTVRAAPVFDEAIRALRNSILLRSLDQQRERLRAILITSASPGEGKTTIAVHLAMACASQGKRTLLIDADLRRPSVHYQFGLTPVTGLSNIINDGVKWTESVVSISHIPNLFIIPAGEASATAADLIGGRMMDLRAEFREHFDFVIIDGPPLLAFAEPLEIASAADGVLIVSLAGKTKRDALIAVLAAVKRSGTRTSLEWC